MAADPRDAEIESLRQEVARLKSGSQRESALLNAIIAQAPMALCVLEGPDYVFKVSNPAHLRLMNAEGKQLVGKPLFETMPELLGQGYDKLLEGVYRSGQPWARNEARLLLEKRAGQAGETYIDFSCQPIHSAEGAVDGVLFVSTDVTEKVEARRALEEALLAREDFLSIASHELKTPLTSLKLQIQMARRSTDADKGLAPDPARLAQMLASADRQVSRLESLVEDLLDVARMRGGGLELRLSEADLGTLVRDAAERFGAELKETGTPLKMALPAGIRGSWDASRIEQVVANLLGNAIKHAPGSTLEVSAGARDGWATVTVRDHGPGIPLGEMPTVFEKFKRGSEPRRAGLGLGLFIAKEIAQAHQGGLSAENHPGGGTVFTLALPLRPA